jgi:hypothetical protein
MKTMRTPVQSLLIAIALIAAATLMSEGCITKSPTPDSPPKTATLLSSMSAPGTRSSGSQNAIPPTGPGSSTSEGTAAASAKASTPAGSLASSGLSLGAFDATLQKEQQKLAQQRDARQMPVSGIAATDAEPMPGKRGDSTKGAERSGDLKSDRVARGAATAASGNGFTPREVRDGNDDDIVSRRLRKAAEQETDPELREKLWKEYADYKQNAQAK